MSKYLYSLAALAILLSSCEAEIRNTEPETVTAPEIIAEHESQSAVKSFISVDEEGEGTIYWTPADQINIFYGTISTQYTSQNTENATTAVFRTTDVIGSTESASTNIWGLYPYDEEATCSGTAVTTTLPAGQFGIPETFDDDLFITLGHSATTSLKFFNVCGGIKFSLSRDDITSISFKGNNNEDLAGDISLTFENNLPTATIVNGLKEITLTPKTGTTFAKNANYYLILLPGTLSGGFTMTFTSSDGAIGTFNYTTKAITIKRSVFSKKAEIDTYATFVEGPQPTNVIYYTSTDGNIVTPYATNVFGASIVSNEYVNGRGVITFDGDVTSIGENAFYNKWKINSIRLPNTVISIGNSAFYNCSGFASIVIPENVISIGNSAFGRCSHLSSITLPESISSIGAAVFWGCESLSSFSGKYASADGLFLIKQNCIIAVALGVINGSVTIPESVIGIGESVFRDCTSLTSIIIPELVVSIGDSAFYGCSNLTSVSVLSETPPSGSDKMFSGSSNISIYVPANSLIAYNYAIYWDSYSSKIKALPGTEVSPLEDFNPDRYLVYRANKTEYSSGRDWYSIESHMPGISGSKVEMKIQFSDGTNKMIASDNRESDYRNTLKLNNGRLIWTNWPIHSDDADCFQLIIPLSDYNLSETSQMVIYYDSINSTFSVNNNSRNCQGGEMSFQWLFTDYYSEYDEGRRTAFTGIPDGSKLFYVKTWDASDNLTYLGYAKSFRNPETGNIDYCWLSYYPATGQISYDFANDAHNQGGYSGYPLSL